MLRRMLDMLHKTEEEDGENCLKGNLIIFILHQIVFKTFRSRKMRLVGNLTRLVGL
jgi:hypothetical protein